MLGLMGPIESLIADSQIIQRHRPLPGGGEAPTENEDTASAVLHFASGGGGVNGTSRSAWGCKRRLDWKVHGTAGMRCFRQERMNALQRYRTAGPEAEQGFTTILTGPAHPPYGQFCPAQGHQIGFTDLKIIEAFELVETIAGWARTLPDFTRRLGIKRFIHAIAETARQGGRHVFTPPAGG